jgi:serine/threonine protein kinase
MEYCPGGNLGELLMWKRRLNETETRFYAVELILAIGHLHNNNIIFRYSFLIIRDLKPDNVVLDKEGHIKITDFGLAKQVGQKNLQTSFCGYV